MLSKLKTMLRPAYSTNRVIVNGKNIIVPIIEGKGGVNLRQYEPTVDAFFAAVMKHTPGTFLDVGANLGQTLIKVRAYDSHRSYYGFEASAFCCYYVDRLIAENRFDNAFLIPFGLSAGTQLVTFSYENPDDPQGTIVENFWTAKTQRSNKRTILVQAGDQVIESLKIEDISIIKIDVEGGELEVLQGLKSTITKYRPMIVCEVLPFVPESSFEDDASKQSIRQRQERAGKLVDLLKAANYVAHRFLPDGSLEETFDFGMDKYDDMKSNYFFCPLEKTKSGFDIAETYAARVKGVKAA